jgi:hypothetical protein
MSLLAILSFCFCEDFTSLDRVVHPLKSRCAPAHVAVSGDQADVESDVDASFFAQS